MVKVFVAQTQEKDRNCLCDFLSAARHDPQPFATDLLSRVSTIRSMMFAAAPFVIISSQRGPDSLYVSNMLHAAAASLPVETLTIVWTRALAQHQYMEETAQFLAALVSTPSHRLELVPKRGEVRRADEYQAMIGHIDKFLKSLMPKNE